MAFTLPPARMLLRDKHRWLKRRLGFLEGTWRELLSWPLGFLVLAVLGWALLLIRLEDERRDIERFALKESATLAQAYADHLARSIDAIDQVALFVKFAWNAAGNTLSLENMRQEGLFPASELVLVSVVDKEGRPLTSTQPIDRSVNVADRDHFKAHLERKDDSLFISEPVVGRLSGKTVIQFSRKLTDRAGSFNGVVVVSVSPEYFALSFEAGPLTVDDMLAAVGTEGTIRVSRIGKAVESPGFHVLRQMPAVKSHSGSIKLNGSWFTDNRVRFVSWNAVPGQPDMLAVVGRDEYDQLLPYEEARASSIRLAVLATLIAAVITAYATVSAARLAHIRHHARTVNDAYRLATETASDAFYILEAIDDADGNIVDFETVDCNERGAQLVGRERADLLGLRVSAMYAPRHFKPAMVTFLRAMQDGVYEDDYEVPKGSVIHARWAHRRLVRSGRSLAVTVRDITQTKQHIDELERRGHEDALTALHNRHWLHGFLPRALEESGRQDEMMALLYIDIDGFKAVNDTMGHAAGDELLRIAASRLKSIIRPQDKAVRLGGDEFLIMMQRLRHDTEAAQVAQRVVELFSEKFKLSQGVHAVGVSVGVSLFPKDGADAKTLLQNADVAMYSAKQSGKGQFRFYDPAFYDDLRSRLRTERMLREAVESDQFVIHYQPRVDVETGRVCGLEALVRWNHPEEGLMEPLRFIHIAEETGLIHSLGRTAIEKVCAQLASWAEANQKCVPVSINVSPRQFQEGSVKRVLEASLNRHHVLPEMVEIEVTENSMMGETEDISQEMDALQTLGVKLLVDDFGTGYSSLSQLQRLDMDGLKIDRAFTSELGRSKEGEILFTAIVTMAHALGMRVVAEGVETLEQARILKRLGCDEIQGYYVSRPVPANEVPPLIERRIRLAA
ncbi:bifunctional diguanylate cyclase/phosphodiesterase [Noviherbaspirillum galbum]|uniref:EAL domain-containing protein n=1 Tax=Noviherbaspirillum galbum TaxID=2709383 RepID=A0A6B3ST09_9BURK|nr:EAL domain-containing protein [Noviherbaspirillum galbum]NEX64110.1 EAL domain-containing protein [Noviherbaspirillum galbum]